MSRVIQLAAAYVYGAVTGNWYPFVAQLFGAHQDSKTRKQRRRAIAEANAAIPDRLQMLDMQADAPRTIVLGRNRTVEGIRRKWVSGAQNERLTMIVSVAGHEIDGFEGFYFDDQEITLDASGWVLTAPWLKSRREVFTKQAVLNGSGGAVLTLTDTAPPDASGQTTVLGPPIASTAFAVWETGSGDNLINGSATVSVVGTTATVTGGQAGTTVTVSYARDVGVSYARVRSWRGAPGQNVGAAIVAEYPGKITASDKFTGIAVMLLDFFYDTDVYTQGPPQPTARVRGARLYDPRKDSTVGGSGAHRLATPSTWEYSANAALCAYHYARHANGWAIPGAEIRTADVVEAANFCDLNTAFTLRKPDTSTSVVNLPRYSCGIVINTAGDPGQAMDEIMETMAGRKAWCGGSLRMRAGMRKAPSFTVTPDWIAVPEGEEGGESPVQIINGVLRDSRINRVTGKCIDPDLRYQMLPFPAVDDPVLIAAKGLATTEVEFNGVNHIAQAQHLGNVAIRETQASLRMNLRCGMRAWPVEVLDVGAIQLPRFGLAGNTMEVVGTRWHPIEGVRLKLEEISEGMYTPVAELRGRDPAPDSNLPAPWDVGVLTGLTVASNVSTLADGSIVTRTVVGWDLATRRSVRQGGEIEVQYIQATGTLPPGEWPSTTERGNAVSTTIVGLPAGRFFRFRARPVQLVPMVRGDWVVSPPHLVAGPRAPRVYRQAAVPSAGVQDGDEWFDQDDGDKHYLRIGGAWVLVRDAGIAAAEAAAAAAASAASAAQTSANAANAALADIASDSLLTADEKPRVIQDRDVIVAEQAGIDAQATAYGITTEKTAYDNAVAGLVSYLATLTSPVLWSNLAGNTTIVGATFRAKFADVYTTRQTLLNRIYASAKSLADSASASAAAAQSTATAAQSAAAAAQTSANNANAALADIASDSLLTPDEKPRVIQDRDVIVAEQAGIDAQATAYGITTEKTAYDNAVSTLVSYLATLTSPVLWSSFAGNTTIVGATFRTRFADVYTTRQTLLNRIYQAAKSIGDAAAAAAALAQSAATAAQTSANSANAALADIASDSVLTPGEKPRVIQDRDVIVAEQTGIGLKATAQGITTEKTAYDNAVSALTTYLATLTTPVLWSNLAGNTTIVGATFRAKFADVYAARQTLLNEIAVRIATGAVGTDQIAPGAVAPIATAEQGGSLTLTLTETDVVSATINSGGAPIYVSASVNAAGGYSARDSTFRIKMDGTTVLTKIITAPGDPDTVGNQWFVTGAMLQFVIAAPASGTRTIKITAVGSDAVFGVTVAECNLYVEAKKR